MRSNMWSIYHFTCLVVMLGFISAATVPSVNLCAYESCPTVSRMGMGTLHLGDRISGMSNASEINVWIQHAVSTGITLFDLADVYPVKGGTEGDSAKLFGQALAMTPGLREQITVVCKMGIIWPTAIDTTNDHLTSTVNWFLSSLGTNYLDIILIHYSNANMDANAVASTFQTLKASGKVKHFGVSNHYPSKFDLLQAKLDDVTGGDIKLVTHEFEMSVWNPSYFNYDAALVDHAYQHSLHPLAWGSLGGDPTGGLNRLFIQQGDRQKQINLVLHSVGKDMGIEDNSVVAFVWLLSHPVGAIPLIGTSRLDRIDTQITAFNYLGKMSNDQWYTIADVAGVCALGDSQCNYDLYKR